MCYSMQWRGMNGVCEWGSCRGGFPLRNFDVRVNNKITKYSISSCVLSILQLL